MERVAITGKCCPDGATAQGEFQPLGLLVVARDANRLLSALRVEILLQVFFGDCAFHAIRRHFGVRRPQQRIQDDLAEVFVAPVLVKMRAGETEAAPAVRPFDRPGEDLLASAGGPVNRRSRVCWTASPWRFPSFSAAANDSPERRPNTAGAK